MKPFNKCPICGEEIVEKEVEKLLRGGNNTAVLRVKAEVCLHCGERLYTEEQVQSFESIRKKLANNDIQEYECVGYSYHIST
jgi:YgiT-type zinc finger domain-containing protein